MDLREALAKIPKEHEAKVIGLFEQLQIALAINKIRNYKPYAWQKEFHAHSQTKTERMLCAANRVGKTMSAAAEVTYHLTGDYPDWWEGKRFDKPVLVWTGSPTNETSRDIVQAELLGGVGEKLGTGAVPKSKIVGQPTTRQAGVKNVVESFSVRHKSGGLSTCSMKTYEMGWQKFQGTAPHVVWLDEEPDDYMIYSECQTRILTTRGIILVTFTPLLGMTELVQHFHDGGDGIYIKNATWDDAPHLSEADKKRLSASYRDHERDARTQGIPMMGEGAVFPISDKDIKIEPFEIPKHWARIKGCDFGLDHPAAGVELAWDRDQDIVYVIDCYKKEGEHPAYHAAWFKKGAHARVIPVAWPHDGLNREKTGSSKIAFAYRDHGANMMSKSARYPKGVGEKVDKGGAQPLWPVIDDLLERMRSGRFKVFSHLAPWFEEKRGYYRKDGRLSTKRDDILKATFYALMMLRYAIAPSSIGNRGSSGMQRPIASTRIE